LFIFGIGTLSLSLLSKYFGFLLILPVAYHLWIFRRAVRFTRWGTRTRQGYSLDCVVWNGFLALLYKALFAYILAN
jgi:hypothetical protein